MGGSFYQFSAGAVYKDVGLALGLGFLVVLAGAGYYFLVRKQAESLYNEATESFSDWLIIGALIVIATTLPIVLAGRNVIFGIQWDRYTYQSVFGVALLVGGFIFYALRTNLRWMALAFLLISGVSTQVFSGMYYRDLWDAQREAWWQLYWRAPRIKNGTTVIASLPDGFQFAEEYEVWGPLNLIYHRGEELLIPGQVGYKQVLIDLEQGKSEERLVRGTITVFRDYGQALVISIASNDSCLHVYNSLLSDISPAESANIAMMVPYSDINQIQIDAEPPPVPTQIMGAEPEHRWCYFYQKINLSLQAGDWAKAVQFAEEARLADLQPQDQAEWMPVLEAYANHNEEKNAKRVSTFITDKDTRHYLCQQLKKVSEWPDGYRSDIILKVLCNSK